MLRHLYLSRSQVPAPLPLLMRRCRVSRVSVGENALRNVQVCRLGGAVEALDDKQLQAPPPPPKPQARDFPPMLSRHLPQRV